MGEVATMQNLQVIETTEWTISPEILEVANTYLETMDRQEAAGRLNMPVGEVNKILNKKEVSRYIDSVFMEQGYLNRGKLMKTLNSIIDQKLDAMLEDELTSDKDIADLLLMAHKISEDHAKRVLKERELDIKEEAAKAPKPGSGVSITNNYGENYNNLLGNLLGTK